MSTHRCVVLSLPATRVGSQLGYPLFLYTLTHASNLVTLYWTSRPVTMSDEDRYLGLAWLFEANFNIMMTGTSASDSRCAFAPCRRSCSSSGGSGGSGGGNAKTEIACFFNLESPNKPRIGAIDMVRAGLLRMPFMFGWTATKRLLEVKAWYVYIHAVHACPCNGVHIHKPEAPHPHPRRWTHNNIACC